MRHISKKKRLARVLARGSQMVSRLITCIVTRAVTGRVCPVLFRAAEAEVSFALLFLL